ncbi:hypothetical protein BS47DRAFT_1380783 [Hydnum rufescens UP504]|uniref:Uncharacterized protein n=1 Tax=Hydnum rufescens UP504 TaxID=1448309 RepID=A0A9P6B388_9AGAM|nr:hypothetical protein BS47DRAFT_1380783 [Hydnum rufescens UP504]
MSLAQLSFVPRNCRYCPPLKMSKRKQQADDNLEATIDSVKELLQPLFDEGGNDLVGRGILRIVHDSGMTAAALLRLEKKNPSFSAAKWASIVPSLGLRDDLGISQLETLTIPQAILPPSFHRQLMKNSSQWIDVYQEPENHHREEARWYVPVCSLFHGRLVDKPENPMPSTPETSGGEVEHEVFLFNNLILFIIEMKFVTENDKDYFAQVLLKLVSAIELNRDRDFDPQPPIYAMLSDLTNFYFLSYDGTKFRWMDEITVPKRPRVKFMNGMSRVSDVLFSLLLHGYIGVLAAVEQRSTMRNEAGDSSKHNSFSAGSPLIKKSGRPSPRPSLDGWSKALLKAREAQTVLAKPNFMTEETWERDSMRGMALLTERYLNKFGSAVDWTDNDSRLEIDGMMAQHIEFYRSRANVGNNGSPCVTTWWLYLIRGRGSNFRKWRGCEE